MKPALSKATLALAALAWAASAAPAHADRPQGLSPQTIKLPKGPASLKGLGESFAANPAMGTGSFSIPLALPPGHLAPELALAYAAGKGKGALGLSFDLPVAHIYRTTDKGSPRFDEEDRFAVSGPGLNDELVLVSPEERLYRLKNEGAFALFARDAIADAWTVHMPNGPKLEIGASENSRQTARGRTCKWWITRQIDPFDHEVVYRYRHDQFRFRHEAADEGRQ